MRKQVCATTVNYYKKMGHNSSNEEYLGVALKNVNMKASKFQRTNQQILKTKIDLEYFKPAGMIAYSTEHFVL